MTPRARSIALVLGVAGAAVGLVAAPAAAEPTGSASGVEGGIETPITDVTLPPIPLVKLPPGGENALQSLDVPPLVSAGVLEVASNAIGANGSESSSSVADATAIDGVLPVEGVAAALVTSACAADPSGTAADAAIVDGSALGVPLDVSPAPNTSFDVPGVGSVTINEQTESDAGVTVRAIHVVVDTGLGVGADVAIATSVCGAGASDLPDAPPATPTSSTPSLAG